MADRFIMPAASGTGSGESWENAGRLSDLQDFIVQAGAGGRVYLRADAGVYGQLTSYNIWSGGDPGFPVHVMGADVNLNPMHAEIIGTRASPYDPDGDLGSEGFRINSSADWLTFSYLSFVNIGNGAFRVTRDTDGLVIQDVIGTNVTRLIENNSSSSGITADITNFAFRRITVNGYSRGVLRLRYDSRDGVIEDVIGDSEQQDKGNFAIGIAISDTSHNITLQRCEMSNALDTTGGYWNGDGFTTERGNRDIEFRNCSAFNNSDGGFDCKGNVLLKDCVASGNKRNFRIWDKATLIDCFSENPTKLGGTGGSAHVWISAGSDATLKNFRHRDTRTPVVDMRDGPSTVKFVDTQL